MTEQKSDFIIELNHISKCFKDKCVLDDVSISVKRGEFVTIFRIAFCIRVEHKCEAQN